MIDTQRLTRWYDFQAPFYRWWRNDYGHPIVQRVTELLAESGPRHALLDAGCGTGLFTIALARAFPRASVDGLDASGGMLRIARREAARNAVRGARFVHGDLLALPYRDDQFDGVVVAGVFPGLVDRARALIELRRVLRSAGRVVLVEFDRNAMRARTRAFVWILIAGYRLVSSCARRYRFATGWNLTRSTVDRPVLEHEARQAGLRICRVETDHEHLFFVLEKG